MAIKRTGRYEAGCNLLWTDPLYTATPGIPVSQRSIKLLQQHYFASPAPFPCAVVIAVQGEDMDPLACRGALQRLSPEDIVHALLLKIAEDIAFGADEAVLQAWRRTLLSTTFIFEPMENDDAKFYRAVSLRETFVTDFRAMARSAVQRVFEVVGFLTRKEKAGQRLSAADVAAQYAEHVQMSENSEQVTLNFVECAVTLWRRAFQNPAVLRVLLRAEEFSVGTPFDSVNKMHVVVYRAKTEPYIAFAFECIADWVAAGEFLPSDVSVRALRAWIVDMCNLRMQLREHFQHDIFPSVDLPTAVGAKFCHILSSYENYRHHVPYSLNATTTPFQAAWSRGQTDLFDLAEAMPPSKPCSAPNLSVSFLPMQ